MAFKMNRGNNLGKTTSNYRPSPNEYMKPSPNQFIGMGIGKRISRGMRSLGSHSKLFGGAGIDRIDLSGVKDFFGNLFKGGSRQSGTSPRFASKKKSLPSTIAERSIAKGGSRYTDDNRA